MNSRYVVAVFEAKKLEIFQKSNSDQTSGIQNNNLDYTEETVKGNLKMKIMNFIPLSYNQTLVMYENPLAQSTV